MVVAVRLVGVEQVVAGLGLLGRLDPRRFRGRSCWNRRCHLPAYGLSRILPSPLSPGV